MESTNPVALLVLIIIRGAPFGSSECACGPGEFLPKDKAVLKTSPKTVMLRFDAASKNGYSKLVLDGKGHKVKLPSQHGYAAGSPAQLIIAVPSCGPIALVSSTKSWPPAATYSRVIRFTMK